MNDFNSFVENALNKKKINQQTIWTRAVLLTIFIFGVNQFITRVVVGGQFVVEQELSIVLASFLISYFFFSRVEKEKGREALQKEIYQSLFEFNIHSTFIVDMHGRIVKINESAERLIGWKNAECEGKQLSFLIDPAEIEKELELFEMVIINKKSDFHEINLMHKNGQKIIAELVSVPIIINNRAIGVIGKFNDVTEKSEYKQKLEELNEKLNHIAKTDGLTQIANRRHFEQILENVWREAIEKKQPLSLIMFDIDEFKKYNDKYGHRKGDECLKGISACVKERIEGIDGLFVRYGGEEFVILLPNTKKEEACRLAEEIRSAIEALETEKFEIHERITASVGVHTTIATEENDIDSFIMTTDKALYHSKAKGKNKVTFSDEI